MNVKKPAGQAVANKKTEKRELAMGKILNATLDLIASGGLPSLSHRTIASAAGVQLAMTTYYFGTLDKIIASAFDVYLAQTQPYLDDISAQADELYLRYESHGSVGDRLGQYVDDLSALITEYINTELANRKRLLKIGCQFLFAQNSNPILAGKVAELNESLLDIAERSCARLGSGAPRIDALLVLYTIRQFEFSSVNLPQQPDLQLICASIKRLLTGFSLQR